MPVKACPKNGHPYYVGRCPVCQADRIKVRDWRSRRKIKSGWEWGRIRDQIHRRDRLRVVCGATPGLEVHHRIPLAQGGSNRLDNLELRCHDHHTHAPAGKAAGSGSG